MWEVSLSREEMGRGSLETLGGGMGGPRSREAGKLAGRQERHQTTTKNANVELSRNKCSRVSGCNHRYNCYNGRAGRRIK